MAPKALTAFPSGRYVTCLRGNAVTALTALTALSALTALTALATVPP